MIRTAIPIGRLRRAVLLLAVALGIAGGLTAAAPAVAQGVKSFGDVIAAVRVTGNQRIENETILSYMKVVVGDRFNSARIDASLKSLFATGLFADVSMRREGRVLVVEVVENPIINRIAFEGNKRIKDETLAGEMQLRPRVVYTRTKVQKDVARILELYRRSGRFAATVEPKVIQLPQNRVDLAFEITEGPLTGVQRIVFIGNKTFSDSSLREVIQTKQSRWWRFLTTTDNYDPDRLNFDRELLRRFYLKEGFADFRVINAVAELTPSRDNFYMTFTLDEGERYRFGDIKLTSDLPGLDTDKLWDQVKTAKGDWYNADLIEDSIQSLTESVGAMGYAFVDIQPKVSRDRDNRAIAVTYDIREGPRVYVDRIDITGNVRTLDRVIRRNMRVAEGDAFNPAKLRRSRQVIQDLGFFSRVDIQNQAGGGPDRTVVNIDVAEQSTGDITFGAGFSTLAGVIGSAGVRERNLLGRGQDLSLSFTLSRINQNIQLSFTEPYFLNRNVAAGFDVFSTRDEFRESSFDRSTRGFGLRAGYPLGEFLTQNLRYTLRKEDIDPFGGASTSIFASGGRVLTSLIGQTLSYNRLDNRQQPTKGFFLRLSNDFAGVGGSRKWLRSNFQAGRYESLGNDWVASLIGQVGYIVGFADQNILISDRFFLGGNDFRGFKTAGVGPRDIANGNALGGNLLYKATGEVTFPLGLPEELGIKGRAFSVLGTLTQIDESNIENLADTGSLRMSVGVGVSWNSPFGPVRLNVSRPVISEDFDEKEFISFGFGSFF